MRAMLPAVAALLEIVVALQPVPAAAQVYRTFVSGGGSDSNPCTRTQPCATFQQAYNVTAAGGEIVALDSADYGPLTIAHSLTVTAAGVEAGVTAANNGDAIDIFAGPNDVVVLRGLVLNGAVNGGEYGIAIASAGAVYVENCLISGFFNGNANGGGILLEPFDGQPALTVTDSSVIGNVYGVVVATPNGNFPFVATSFALNNDRIEGNAIGVYLLSSAEFIYGVIDGGRVDFNTFGVLGYSLAPIGSFLAIAAPALVLLTDVDVSYNSIEAIITASSDDTIYIDHNIIYNNGVGLDPDSYIVSFGNNAVYGNNSNNNNTNGSPSQTVSQE